MFPRYYCQQHSSSGSTTEGSMHTTWQARPKEKPLFARCICEHGHRYLQRADLRLRQLPLRASHCCAKASAMISSNSCNLLVLKSSVPRPSLQQLFQSVILGAPTSLRKIHLLEIPRLFRFHDLATLTWYSAPGLFSGIQSPVR